MNRWVQLEELLPQVIGQPFRIQSSTAVGGGCINQVFRLDGEHHRFFLKANDKGKLPMFEAEARALERLRKSHEFHVPKVIYVGTFDEHAGLVLEYIDLKPMDAAVQKVFGQALAGLHRVDSDRFGWEADNFIGSTAQRNTKSLDWVTFFGQQRLKFQLDLAGDSGYGGRLQSRGLRLIEVLNDFFSDYLPTPSLLHGDLWSGNVASDSFGRPVIFDPASYFGDREADVAMTELFGGFHKGFYQAYDSAWPLDPGYPVRRTLYNLYHLLNHLNLFGGGYRSQAEHSIDRLLACVGH